MTDRNQGLSPRVLAEAVRMKLVDPAEVALFLGDEHPAPPDGAVLIWRVNYWRGASPEPKFEVFRTLADAKHHARKVAKYSPNGPGGRVVTITIEEALIKTWAVIDRRDLHDDPASEENTHDQPEPVGQLEAQDEEATMPEPDATPDTVEVDA